VDDVLRAEALEKWVDIGGRRLPLVKPASFQLTKGERVAIMGPSGSGKSTLLHLLGLLDCPSAGSLKMIGEETTGMDERARAQLRARAIGFVFQSFNLLPHLTVFENVALPLFYAGKRPDRTQVLVQLERVGMAAHENTFPTTLSGGEKQRVAIARAVINKPAIVLADEPTGALDSENGRAALDCLLALESQGTTVVIVTHDAGVAQRCPRMLQLRDGTVS
jgi:putative ABC transport system ATP-binding protein